MIKLDQKEDVKIVTNFFTFMKLENIALNDQENRQRVDQNTYKQD